MKPWNYPQQRPVLHPPSFPSDEEMWAEADTTLPKQHPARYPYGSHRCGICRRGQGRHRASCAYRDDSKPTAAGPKNRKVSRNAAEYPTFKEQPLTFNDRKAP